VVAFALLDRDVAVGVGSRVTFSLFQEVQQKNQKEETKSKHRKKKKKKQTKKNIKKT